MKTKCTRGIIYFIGLIVLALGIVLNTKTLLGVSPIISIPYNICHIWHLNLGAITFVFYCFCVLIEAILKGKEFKLYELLQIPMSLVTSVFINIFDRYLNIVPDTLGQKLLVLFFAIVVTGIGAATMVNMKLVPNPADALAATIGDKLGKGMGIGKNVFDVTCFCTSGIIGLVFTRHIIGLGIGTVLAVIFTGRVIAVYNYFLKHPMQNLAGITIPGRNTSQQTSSVQDCSRQPEVSLHTACHADHRSGQKYSPLKRQNSPHTCAEAQQSALPDRFHSG